MTVERFANDAATHLDLPAGIGDSSIGVQSTTHFPTQPEFRIRVSEEKMLVTGVAGTTWTVTRGIEGTTAASHAVGTRGRHQQIQVAQARGLQFARDR